MDVNGDRIVVDLGVDGLTVDGVPVRARIEEIDGTPLVLLDMNGSTHRLAVQRNDDGERGRYTIWTDGQRLDVEALDERRRAIRDMTGAGAAASGPAPLIAPMPGLVIRVAVEAGQAVEQGQPMVVMEAMKMENELRAASAGVVHAVRVTPGQAVEKGAVLVELAGRLEQGPGTAVG